MMTIFATAIGSLAMAAGDVTKPVVTSVTPADGSTIYTNGSSTIYYQAGNTTPMVIKADYSDEVGGSGVDPASVMVHLDGGNMLDNCPVQTETHVECVATAADLYPGSHTLDIYVADLDSNLTVNPTTLTVVVDNQAPTYTNLLPVNGSTIYTSQLNSSSTIDPSALRFDYDLTDAAPSSGYSPMSHINDNVPPGVSGAMISNTSCVKTPATNPTHYSCQANRASLLHLGDNTLSVLLKDKVGNTSSDYTDSSSLKHYTVADDVLPVVSGLTADATTISANYSDPNPTGALSANLASGVNATTAMVHIDGTTDVIGCTATGTGISCPTPSGLAVGTHAIEVMVRDNAGNMGMETSTLTTAPAPPTLIGSYELGKVFFIEDGKRRAIASPGVFTNWGFSWSNVTWAPLSQVNSYPQGDNLTLLAVDNAGRVYLVQNNTFRHIFDANTFNIFKDNWGLGWGDIKPVSDGVFASKSQGAEITFPRLVTYSYGGAVYYMDSDGKRPIQNAPTFMHWGFHWNEIFYTKNNAFLAGYPAPHPLSVLAVSPQGMVYLISNGEKRPIASAQSFINHATFDPVYNWNNIFPVSTWTLNNLPTGAMIY